ncbi:MAG TPA: ChbG/HpnK family deacetylase [Gemmatimonadales bacterium]|nr:ChbG/HpnK family deacetylase [Gemmatimonadales bacterium]
MRRLIVNGDDFGASLGINRGIVEAHGRGVLTSASLMVDGPAAADAVTRARENPALSLGLHLELDSSEPGRAAAQCERQLARFLDLTGAPPTHVDSHHDVHRDPRVLPYVLALARSVGVPLRGHSAVRHVGKFYGQWGGVTHAERIGVDGFLRVLDAEIGPDVTELSCHPGYIDAGFPSSYRAEREIELRTLCDPTLRRAILERGITLIGFRDLRQRADAVTVEAP